MALWRFWKSLINLWIACVLLSRFRNKFDSVQRRSGLKKKRKKRRRLFFPLSLSTHSDLDISEPAMILCRPRWRTFISDSWIHNLFNSRYNYNTTYGHKLISKQQQNSHEHRDHIMGWRCAHCTWFDRWLRTEHHPSIPATHILLFIIHRCLLFVLLFSFYLFLFVTLYSCHSHFRAHRVLTIVKCWDDIVFCFIWTYWMWWVWLYWLYCAEYLMQFRMRERTISDINHL